MHMMEGLGIIGIIGLVFVIIILISTILAFKTILEKHDDYDEEANMTTFKDLPDDVIRHILSSEFLPTIAVLRMSRLSKQSRRMWNDWVHVFDFCDSRDRRIATRLGNRITFLNFVDKCLRLNYFSDRPFTKFKLDMQ